MVLWIGFVFIFVHLVSPVHLNYVYEETPNVGFVSDNNVGVVNKEIITTGNNDAVHYSMRNSYSSPGKYGSPRRFQSNAHSGIHMVDSHFKLQKTSTSTSKADQRVKFNVEQYPRATDAPKENIQRKYPDEPTNKNIEPKIYNARPLNGFAPQNYGRDEKSRILGVPHTKPYSKVTKDHRDPYLVNVRKTQVTSGQKVKFNNNQFVNIRRDDSEVSISAKAQQKNLEEIHMQAKSKYNQVNQKKLDRRHYDATEQQGGRDAVTHPGLAPTVANVMKAVPERESVKSNTRLGVPRIGGWNESIEVKPYALFYRISQDPTKRQFDNVQHFINENEEEIKTDNYVEQMVHNAPSAQPTNPSNNIKLRMKIKKYSNFRSH